MGEGRRTDGNNRPSAHFAQDPRRGGSDPNPSQPETEIHSTTSAKNNGHSSTTRHVNFFRLPGFTERRGSGASAERAAIPAIRLRPNIFTFWPQARPAWGGSRSGRRKNEVPS